MAKKSRLQSIDLGDYYDKRGELSIKGFDELFTPTTTGVNLSKYEDGLGQGNVNINDPELPSRLAMGQSTGSKLLSTLNRAAVGEVIGGSIEGIGHLGDLGQTVDALQGETQEWGNWLTDIGKDLRTWSEESTPIYLDPEKEGQFMPWTSDWWYENAPSMASTLSLMLPAAGAVKGMSMLGKALSIGQELGKGAKWATNGISQAVVSRLMENGMEALGTYDSSMQDLLQKGVPEEVAKKVASEAASGTWNANWAMLAQDIPQYLLLNKAFGKAAEETTAGIAKTLGKSIIPPTLSKGKAIALDMLSEGAEEGYQYIASEESRHLAEVS